MTDHPQQQPGLPHLLYAVAQDARRLIDAGNPVEAIARLAAALQLLDPVAAAADPDLIDAALIFAPLAPGVPADQLSWARYAYRASLHVYGPVHDVTVQAGEVLSDVLQLQRLGVDAIIVLQAQADAYIRRRDLARATVTRSRLATLLHDGGRGNPKTDADLLWDHSPLSRADQIDVPLLLTVGANDPVVPTSECDQLVAKLTRRGIAHTYVSYADDGHHLVQPANRLYFYALAEQFLAQYLGGRAQPLGEQPVPASVTITDAGPQPVLA